MATHHPVTQLPAPADERRRFSERLKFALQQQKKPFKPSTLARAFNVRAPAAAVSPHAARKWLVGEAIPAQERLLVLARWLNVSPSWLRFGQGKFQHFLSGADASPQVSSADMVLLSSIMTLSVPSQQVVHGVVNSLRELENVFAGAGATAGLKALATA